MSLDIGINGCQGNRACQQIAQSSETVAVNISDEACQGKYACQFIAPTAETAVVSILDEACQGDYACSAIAGGEGPGNVSLDIGFNACQGRDACRYISYAATNPAVTISDHACNEELSCEYLGYYKASSVNIEPGGCRGRNACYWLGGGTTFGIDIRMDSCVAESSCESFGTSGTIPSASPNYITILSRGCLGESICSECMQGESAVNVEIPEDGDCSDALVEYSRK